MDWQSDHGIPTAFCLRGANWGRGYAPHFVGTVYRALLEEFSGSMLDESAAKLGEIFHDHIDAVEPFLPPEWIATLRALAARKISFEDGEGFVLEKEESLAIVRRDLNFDQLETEFDYVKEFGS